LAFLFLKYVVFEDAGVAKEAERARAEARLKVSTSPQAGHSLIHN
jgi:hypothetical protein